MMLVILPIDSSGIFSKMGTRYLICILLVYWNKVSVESKTLAESLNECLNQPLPLPFTEWQIDAKDQSVTIQWGLEKVSLTI